LGFTEQQVAYVLRQAESGTPVSKVCRQIGIAEAALYLCKKLYANPGVMELRKRRQLKFAAMPGFSASATGPWECW